MEETFSIVFEQKERAEEKIIEITVNEDVDDRNHYSRQKLIIKVLSMIAMIN